MKKTENLLQAMVDFEEAYYHLRREIESFEQLNKISVNELRGFTDNYPFDKSFDELAIGKWVTEVGIGINQQPFKVLDYQYINTGGNCMVGVFEVWLPVENRTVFALTNEEGCTLSTVDHISNYVEIDDYDELTIDYVDWGRVTGYEKYFELYRYCLNEYNKSDCKHFGYCHGVPYFLLSDELQQKVTPEYKQWMEANDIELYDTNGVDIIEYYDYIAEKEYDEALARTEDRLLQQLKDFREWHNTTAGVEEYYNDTYKLEFAGRKIELPFNADIWDAIDNLLHRAIEEW